MIKVNLSSFVLINRHNYFILILFSIPDFFFKPSVPLMSTYRLCFVLKLLQHLLMNFDFYRSDFWVPLTHLQLLGWVVAAPIILGGLYILSLPCFKILVYKFSTASSSPKKQSSSNSSPKVQTSSITSPRMSFSSSPGEVRLKVREAWAGIKSSHDMHLLLFVHINLWKLYPILSCWKMHEKIASFMLAEFYGISYSFSFTMTNHERGWLEN